MLSNFTVLSTHLLTSGYEGEVKYLVLISNEQFLREPPMSCVVMNNLTARAGGVRPSLYAYR